MPTAGTETGQTPRVDAVPKVTGRAVYTEDLPLPPGTLYGAILALVGICQIVWSNSRQSAG